MAEFLILFRGQDGRSLRPTPEVYQAHLKRLMAWLTELSPRVEFISGEPLGAMTALIHKNKVVTDGPFIEGKEMVGGFLRFRAESSAVAIAWAETCPIFEFDEGCIEIREIDVIDL